MASPTNSNSASRSSTSDGYDSSAQRAPSAAVSREAALRYRKRMASTSIAVFAVALVALANLAACGSGSGSASGSSGGGGDPHTNPQDGPPAGYPNGNATI